MRFGIRTLLGSSAARFRCGQKQNALPSAEQIRRLDLHEASEHLLHTQQTQLHARGPAESHAAAVRLCDVRLRDGGPFGLEDMVTTSGPGLTLLYHLILPFFWCIPVSLVAAELTTAIPVEGGFYAGCAQDSATSGISGGLVELERVVPSRRRVRVLFTDYLQIIFRSTSRFLAGCITPLLSR